MKTRRLIAKLTLFFISLYASSNAFAVLNAVEMRALGYSTSQILLYYGLTTCPSGTFLVQNSSAPTYLTCIANCTNKELYNNAKGVCVSCPTGQLVVNGVCTSYSYNAASVMSSTVSGAANKVANMAANQKNQTYVPGSAKTVIVTHLFPSEKWNAAGGVAPVHCPNNGTLYSGPTVAVVTKADVITGIEMWRCIEKVLPFDPYYQSILTSNNWTLCNQNPQFKTATTALNLDGTTQQSEYCKIDTSCVLDSSKMSAQGLPPDSNVCVAP